ncbi:hypothetical protein [Faecalibacillus faecis]|uniref:hypothetical protein n=1 Tax=Faecalibacillus faecis TaxID=1982628 RepID=UPI0038692708
MNEAYKAVQLLNDRFIELDLLLKDFDNLLSDLKEIHTIYEGENGYEYGEIFTLDEDGIDELRKIYYRLEKIIN